MEVVGVEVLVVVGAKAVGITAIHDGSGQGGSGDLGLHGCRSW